MHGSWKVDHNDQGDLEVTHQHDSGEPVMAEIRTEAGVRFAVCECGAEFRFIDRGRDERASV
jgi:hypothetical protein